MAQTPREMLKDLETYVDYINGKHDPLLQRDRKLGEAFKPFKDAVKGRVKELEADTPVPVKK